VTIEEHATHFAGRPVADWEPSAVGDAGDAGAATALEEGGVYRITLSYEEEEEGAQWTDKFSTFLEQPGVERVYGIVVGSWGNAGTGDDRPTSRAASTGWTTATARSWRCGPPTIRQR
jgi:hypothetical protein